MTSAPDQNLIEAAGYKAIFISVDVPALGRRLNEMRNNFKLPDTMQFPNLLSSGAEEFGIDHGGQAYGKILSPDYSLTRPGTY